MLKVQALLVCANAILFLFFFYFFHFLYNSLFIFIYIIFLFFIVYQPIFHLFFIITFLFLDKILAEPDDFETYFPHINNNSRRKDFYTETCAPEISIVHFLTSAEIREIIRKFRSGIEKEFPSLYYWMDDASLHMSLRAINFVNRVS